MESPLSRTFNAEEGPAERMRAIELDAGFKMASVESRVVRVKQPNDSPNSACTEGVLTVLLKMVL